MKRALEYIWPPGDVAERLSVAAMSLAAVLGLGLSTLDWFGLIDLKSERVISFMVFAAGVILTGAIVEAERRRTATADMELLRTSIEEARSSFASAADPNSARQIPPSQIGTEIEALLENTSMWMFRGGSARYQRSTVLPSIRSKIAGDVPYVLQVPDFRDAALCESYARYRRHARPADVQLSVEDATALRIEILAAVYAAGWHHHNSRIVPLISLLNTFGTIRIDLGSDGAIVTVPDRSQPALLVPSGSFLYAALKDDMEQSSRLLPRLAVGLSHEPYPALSASITGAVVESAFSEMTISSSRSAMAIPILDQLADVDFDAVAVRAFSSSPYDGVARGQA